MLSSKTKIKGQQVGTELITYEMIRALSEESKNTLLATLNDSFQIGNIEQQWRLI